jgi:dienelactone hydrolase
MLRRVFIFATLACALPLWRLYAQPVFDAEHVGGPNSTKHGELFMPETTGPVPAVVVLHGCDGIGKHYRDWARLLRSWGYAALMIDSFGPRGQSNVCHRGNLVPPSERLKDALRAADYLRSLPTIRKDRIGVIGFSHGGWTVLNVVLQQRVAWAGGTPFAAAVAYYPSCQNAALSLVTDTLILIGEDDDWTPARDCRRWREAARTNGHVLDLKIYPGARHGFDSSIPMHNYLGHLLGRDEVAAPDAESLTRAFFAQRLMAP